MGAHECVYMLVKGNVYECLPVYVRDICRSATDKARVCRHTFSVGACPGPRNNLTCFESSGMGMKSSPNVPTICEPGKNGAGREGNVRQRHLTRGSYGQLPPSSRPPWVHSPSHTRGPAYSYRVTLSHLLASALTEKLNKP